MRRRRWFRLSLPPAVNVNAGISAAAIRAAFGVETRRADCRGRPAPRLAAPQITVQVQAMDSQSFLDHSNDIAHGGAAGDARIDASERRDPGGVAWRTFQY